MLSALGLIPTSQCAGTDFFHFLVTNLPFRCLFLPAEHTVEGEPKPRHGATAHFPEKQSTLDSASSSSFDPAVKDEDASSSRGRHEDMEPFLSIIGGIGCGIILITVVLLVTIRMRCGGGGSHGGRDGHGSG